MIEMIEIARRGFLGGLVAAIAAPAIVRSASIMPVRVPVTMRVEPFVQRRFWMIRQLVVGGSFDNISTKVKLVEVLFSLPADQMPLRCVDSLDIRSVEDWEVRRYPEFVPNLANEPLYLEMRPAEVEVTLRGNRFADFDAGNFIDLVGV
jgi:hypothetical protein